MTNNSGTTLGHHFDPIYRNQKTVNGPNNINILATLVATIYHCDSRSLLPNTTHIRLTHTVVVFRITHASCHGLHNPGVIVCIGVNIHTPCPSRPPWMVDSQWTAAIPTCQSAIRSDIAMTINKSTTKIYTPARATPSSAKHRLAIRRDS